MDQTPIQQSTNPLSNLPGGLSQKKLIVIVIGVVVIGALGMVAKGIFRRNASEFMAEKAIERATGGKVDVDFKGDKTVTYKGDEGSVQVGENVSLPSNWPSDVPIISGAKISYAGSSNPTTGQPGAVVMFQVSSSMNEVADYYKTELESNGWNIENTANMGTVTIISAKKDERTAGVSIVTSDEGTSVTLSVQE